MALFLICSHCSRNGGSAFAALAHSLSAIMLSNCVHVRGHCLLLDSLTVIRNGSNATAKGQVTLMEANSSVPFPSVRKSCHRQSLHPRCPPPKLPSPACLKHINRDSIDTEQWDCQAGFQCRHSTSKLVVSVKVTLSLVQLHQFASAVLALKARSAIPLLSAKPSMALPLRHLLF